MSANPVIGLRAWMRGSGKCGTAVMKLDPGCGWLIMHDSLENEHSLALNSPERVLMYWY